MARISTYLDYHDMMTSQCECQCESEKTKRVWEREWAHSLCFRTRNGRKLQHLSMMPGKDIPP